MQSIAGLEAAARLAELLRPRERAVVLTGAGISVPSGIPDFRSPGTGLWEKVDPMEVAHIDAWRRDPDRFWSFYGQRFASLIDKRPNAAHEAVAELERRGLVRGVITQNIDRLHRLAGSERVVEVHGSIECSRCMTCGGRVALDRVVELLGRGDGAPECAACVTPLKPDVVLFGELLPERGDGRGPGAGGGGRPDDLHRLLADGLPGGGAARADPPRLAGGLALVTAGETPYDGEADVKLERRRRGRARRRARRATPEAALARSVV